MAARPVLTEHPAEGAPGRAVRPGSAGAAPERWAGGHGAPARRGAARHHFRAGPIARAGRLRPPRRRRPGSDRARPTGARGAPPSSTGPTPPASSRWRTGRPTPSNAGPAGPRARRWHHARRPGPELRRGAGPPAGRGTADRQRAGRRQEGRAVVGLVGDQDRRRMAARHRRAGLPGTARLPAGLRPGRAGHPRTSCASRSSSDEECAIRLVAAGRPCPRRGHGRRPGRLPRGAAAPGRASAGRPGPTRAGAGAGLGAAGLCRSRRPRARVGRRVKGRSRAALTVRLADLVPGPRSSGSSVPAPSRGLHAAAQAPLRLLRHAGAGRHANRRAGRSGPAGRHLVAKQVTLLRGEARGTWPRPWWRRRRGSAATASSSSGSTRRGKVELEAALAASCGTSADPRSAPPQPVWRPAICSKTADRAAVGPGLGRVVQHELVEAELGVGGGQLVELVDRVEHGSRPVSTAAPCDGDGSARSGGTGASSERDLGARRRQDVVGVPWPSSRDRSSPTAGRRRRPDAGPWRRRRPW